jgi:hypothetical protein
VCIVAGFSATTPLLTDSPLVWCHACLLGHTPAVLQSSFTIHFGFSGLFAAESLRLCFADKKAAEEWHAQLSAAVRRAERMSSSGAWPSLPARRQASGSQPASWRPAVTCAVPKAGTAPLLRSFFGCRQHIAVPSRHAACRPLWFPVKHNLGCGHRGGCRLRPCSRFQQGIRRCVSSGTRWRRPRCRCTVKASGGGGACAAAVAVCAARQRGGGIC